MAKAYLSNKDLYNEIIISRDASAATDKLIGMFALISERLSHKFTYNTSMDKEDCIQAGVIDAWKYFWSFDPSVSTNAFSYVTQIIKNGQSKQHKELYKLYFRDIGYVQISINNLWSL